jgi:DNA repair protein RadD
MGTANATAKRVYIMLREYQTEGMEKLREQLRNKKKRPVMVLPTGGGKSIIFGQVIKNVMENGKRVLWLVHRRNLVTQMQDTLLDHFGIDAGIIMAGIEPALEMPVQLCTVQTYYNRLKLDEEKYNPFFIEADVVLVDEAHRSVSPTYTYVLDHYRDKIIMGCTATPMRADQRGLGEVYDSLVDIIGVKELQEQGHLCKARYFAPSDPDLDGVQVRGGDYVLQELDQVMNNTVIVGDVVENWLKSGENRKTIVFAVNVKHSIALRDEFIKQGVAAEHLDARSKDDERQAVFDRMERGETRVICNVALYQEGLDVPSISCVVMARPTKSLGLWRQCAGRGLRPGKEDLLIFDHGNVIAENGFLDDPIVWSLDGKKKAWDHKREEKEKQPVQCTVCAYVFEGGRHCPECGSPVRSYGKKIQAIDAELEELREAKKADVAMKRRWYGMFRAYQIEKGYKEGWIANKYREKFKVWPKGFKNVMPIMPDQEFRNWMKHTHIKWRKMREKEVA